eukprot:3429461-Prymnesium_polylepis.1
MRTPADARDVSRGPLVAPPGSLPRGDHGPHAHAPCLDQPHRATARTPRGARAGRTGAPPRPAPRRRHADTRTSLATQAPGQAGALHGRQRGTGRLPIRPLNDTYLVPERERHRRAA